MPDDARTLPDDVWTILIRARHGDPDALDAARRMIGDPDPRVRVVALRGVIDELDDATITTALGDESSEVRRGTLELLASRPARDALIDAVSGRLDDADPLVVDAACFLLGEWSASAAAGALAVIATDHDDARCRESAVAALGVLGQGLDAVLMALEDKPPVRRRAVVALSNFDDPRVLAALEQLREDRDWQVRAAAEILASDD